MNLCSLFRRLCRCPKAGPRRLEIAISLNSISVRGRKMTVSAPKGAKITYTAVYLDAEGNVAEPPAGVTLMWSTTDATVETLEATTGTSVVADVVGALNSTASMSVTDGTLTAAPDVLTVIAGPAASLTIQATVA